MTTITKQATPQTESIHAAASESPRWNVYASFGITAAVILAALYHASTPFRSNLSWLVFLQDDCFYYLKVAQNLATGHGSTFNGIVSTNGYHPLWLLLLAGFRFVFRTVSFIRFIAVDVATATIATYFLARRLLARALVSPLMLNALAAFIAAFSMPLFYTGMEVILTIPLVLLFLIMCERIDFARHGLKHALALGLLISAMTLSRIDSILLAALTGLALLLHPQLRRQIKRQQVTGLLLGLIPIALYFAANHHLFGTWLPVSGLAKQLKTNHLPSLPAWHSLYAGPIKHPVSFVPIVAALCLIPSLYRRFSANEQILYPVVLLWPFLYILMLSCVSDWMLWMWYFYPLRPALCVAFILLARWNPIGRHLNRPAVAVLLALFALAKLYTTRWTEGDMAPMADIAAEVQRFALTHPGVYAMGDRSGSVGYLLSQPLVQTEGLMMDRGYLEEIRHALPLRQALAPYHVRFFVATEKPPYAVCYHAMEPAQAGPASPHLTDDLCGSPLAVFDQGDTRTAIYDLQYEPAQEEKKEP